MLRFRQTSPLRLRFQDIIPLKPDQRQPRIRTRSPAFEMQGEFRLDARNGDTAQYRFFAFRNKSFHCFFKPFFKGWGELYYTLILRQNQGKVCHASNMMASSLQQKTRFIDMLNNDKNYGSPSRKNKFSKKKLDFLRNGDIIKRQKEPEEFLAGINALEEPESARPNRF